MTRRTEHEVLGWGYEGKSIVDLLDFAAQHDVSAVVDIRLNPISRKPGFSKRRLADAVAEAGIEYVHLAALGNPRDNRAGFADTDGAAGRLARERFVDEVLTAPEGCKAIDDVMDLADAGPVILLCYEDEEQCCHRSLVLAALNRDEAPLITV